MWIVYAAGSLQGFSPPVTQVLSGAMLGQGGPGCAVSDTVTPEKSNCQTPDARSRHSAGRRNVFTAVRETLEGPPCD